MILLWIFLKYRKAQRQTPPFQEHPGLFSQPYFHFYYCWSYSEIDTGLNYTYKRLYWRRPVLMEAHRGSSLRPSAGHWENRTGSGALSHCWWQWRSITGMKRALNFWTLLKKQKNETSVFFWKYCSRKGRCFSPFLFFFFSSYKRLTTQNLDKNKLKQ